MSYLALSNWIRDLSYVALEVLKQKMQDREEKWYHRNSKKPINRQDANDGDYGDGDNNDGSSAKQQMITRTD